MLKNYFLILSFLPLLTYTQTPGSESAITPINSTLTYQGFGESMAHIGTGEYKIYYDNVDGILDKPIFFVDGFDPGDGRTIPLTYDLLNYGNPVQNLGEFVRDLGFDLIVLNFPTYTSSSDNSTVIDGGADFIQRNAYILVELLNTINAMKVGSYENVIIGPSMGGLISRYALRYMEQNTLDHETGLFLSFDTPHLGANIPISIQYTFSYLVNHGSVTEVEGGLNSINSVAAKQMLIDHYLAHVELDGYTLLNPVVTLPTGAPNFRDAFQTEIDGMGLPQTVRNVAMINGSSLGTTTGTAGANIINHTFNLPFSSTVALNLNFTPAASQTNTVSTITGSLLFGAIPLNFSATSESPSTTDGLDSAPGGIASLDGLGGDNNDLLTEFVLNLNQPDYNFIPTLSALAISNANWYAVPNTASSPFASTYVPDNNQPHVQLNDGNVAFALNEITNTILGLPNNNFEFLRLAKNPVTTSITLLNNIPINNANIEIVDITGKRIYYEKNFTINNRTIIPINFSAGLYILNITAENKILKTKLVVK